MSGFVNAVQPGGSNPTGFTPEAYLTILFFDERFNFVAAADGGVAQQQVTEAVESNGSSLTLANIKAPKNGYAYVYVSNQSKSDVYFDNFQVGITQGNIAEENHYYAYGLKIAGLSSKKLGDSYEGRLKNDYLYNGKELFDDADLNWYDYGFRNYDPQIGRFTQLDPLTFDYPFLTPYQYASCDPITNIDIDGLEGGDAVTQSVNKALSGTAGAAGKVIENVVLKNTPTLATGLSKGKSTMYLLTIIKNSTTLLNTSINTIPVGNTGANVMNNQRYNHHSGRYLPATNSNGGSSSSGGGSSGANRWGQRYTSEFGGGNNAPRGQTDEPSINADFLMALNGSWMGGDMAFAKTWEEIIKKFPDRLIQANEMLETYEYLKNKRAIEDYIKKEYQGETATPIKFQKKQNLPKGQPYKVYFDGTPAPNEKGPGQASHNMPPEGDIPDTIYYPNPKKKSN